MATAISFCHTVACSFFPRFGHQRDRLISLCLYKNIGNEIKPSQHKKCVVLVDMKNTIGCLGKKCKMIIKIILFEVNNNSYKLVLRQAKTFLGDHKSSLTSLLQQVATEWYFKNVRSPSWVCTEREYG